MLQNTPNSFNGHKVIRFHTHQESVITHKDSVGNVIGSVTIHADSELFLKKAPTDTFQTDDNDTVAVPVAFFD